MRMFFSASVTPPPPPPPPPLEIFFFDFTPFFHFPPLECAGAGRFFLFGPISLTLFPQVFPLVAFEFPGWDLETFPLPLRPLPSREFSFLPPPRQLILFPPTTIIFRCCSHTFQADRTPLNFSLSSPFLREECLFFPFFGGLFFPWFPFFPWTVVAHPPSPPWSCSGTEILWQLILKLFFSRPPPRPPPSCFFSFSFFFAAFPVKRPQGSFLPFDPPPTLSFAPPVFFPGTFSRILYKTGIGFFQLDLVLNFCVSSSLASLGVTVFPAPPPPTADFPPSFFVVDRACPFSFLPFPSLLSPPPPLCSHLVILPRPLRFLSRPPAPPFIVSSELLETLFLFLDL